MRGTGRSSSFQAKRSAHTGRPKEAFSIDESSLGGKTESRRNTKSLCSKKRRAYSCRPKEAFGADEGSLGSEKENRREIATALATNDRAVAGRLRKVVCSDEGNCSREDSNLHGFPHTVLSRTRLPVPPREQSSGVYNARVHRMPAR